MACSNHPTGNDVRDMRASSPASYAKLQKSLASQDQLGQEGHPIAGPGTRKPFNDEPRIIATYGGKPGEWVKMSSTSYIHRDGTKFETHWVENLNDGKQVEFKTKIDFVPSIEPKA